MKIKLNILDVISIFYKICIGIVVIILVFALVINIVIGIDFIIELGDYC